MSQQCGEHVRWEYVASFSRNSQKYFFSTHASPDGGVLLQCSDGRNDIRLPWTLGALVQDGAAHRAVWGIKGDSGNKYCLKCGSVWSTPVNEVTNKSMLFLSSDMDVLRSFDRLKAKKAELSSDDFKLWQQATGWTWSDNHVLNCDELRPWLRPVSQFCHDYMHGMASGGCLNVAIYLLLEDLTAAGLRPWSSLRSYMSLWVLPGHLKSVCNMPSFFVEKRVKSHREAEKFKAPASDILCMFPVLAYYAKTVARNATCAASLEAFLAVCDFMQLLLASHHAHCMVTGAQLDAAAERILTSFRSAGWSCIKKFHWTLHYGDSLEAHGLTFIFFLFRIFGATRWDIKPKKITPFLVQDFWKAGICLTFFFLVQNFRKNASHSFFSCPGFLGQLGGTLSKNNSPLFLSRIFGKQKMSHLHFFLVQDFW